MQVLLHVVILSALVLVSTRRDRPGNLAAIYAIAWLLFRLPFTLGVSTPASAAVLVAGTAVFALCVYYFRLLSRVSDSLGWWGIVVAGNIVVFLAGEAVLGITLGVLAWGLN